MKQFECQVTTIHDKNQWFPVGKHYGPFGAKVEMLLRSQEGGYDIGFNEIECRERCSN